MKKDGIFFFALCSLVPKIFMLLYYANWTSGDDIRGHSLRTNHKIKSFSCYFGIM